MLKHIQTSGELTKYWSAVDKQNDEARKAARKVERERKKIEMGSDYQTSDEEREQNELEREQLLEDEYQLELDCQRSETHDE